MNHPYTVALVVEDVDLPASRRIEAEKRYARALESNLGGPAEVAAVLKAWQAANDSMLEDIDQETAETAVRWPRAADKAQQAGMRELGELPGAHFEVRLERDPSRGLVNCAGTSAVDLTTASARSSPSRHSLERALPR